MFSPEYYSKLDPSYREAFLKLESELKWKEPRSDEAQNALMDFIGKYVIPQKLWNLVSHQNKLSFLTSVGGFYNHLMHCRFGPYYFVPYCARLALTLEANDHKFMCDNVERRLGEDLTDKKLWKKYIDYLEKHDFKLLLETYSSYCRFFTDDFKMKEKYRQATIKYNAPVSVPWKNPYKFEVYDDKFWEIEAERDRKVQNVLPDNEPLTIQFDASTAAKQKLPFKIEMLEHILDNANGEVLQKLFKTCKWFHASQPVNVYYKFEETDDVYDYDVNAHEPLKYVEQSIKSFNNSFSTTTNFGQLFISTIFDFRSNNPNALSNFIPRIYRCTAKYVHIENQNLSLEELQFFIEYAVDLELWNVRDSEGKKFSLETVLQLTPKIKRLSISEVEITNESFQKVIDFQYKFESIYFSNVNLDLLDPVKLAEFVMKTCAYDAEITVIVENNINLDAFDYAFVDAMYEKYNGEEEKIPRVYLRG